MWEQINKELIKYLKKYNKEQAYLLDEINILLINDDDLNELIRTDKIKRELLTEDFPKGSYFQYIKENTMKKSKITNKEYVLIMLYLYYIRFNRKLRTLDTFNNIMSVRYKSVINQAKKEHLSKPKPLSFYQTLIMTMPTHLGWTWEDYITSEIIYNANQIMKQYQVDLQQGINSNYKTILDKQQRQHININNKDGTIKCSGSVESMTGFIVNQLALLLAEDLGVEKVKFVGIEDNRQTNMCNSLNGQTFYINKNNKFKRYSESQKGLVEYNVKGLVLGVNLPPITDNFHYCRSTIEIT